MKSIGRCLLLCAFAFASERGLALELALEMHMRAGRYGELVQNVQSRRGGMEARNTEELCYLCYSYSRLKDYSSLSKCLDAAELRIGQGDRSAAWPLLPFELNMTPFPHWLRAEALIELGDYEKAVLEARKGYEIVREKDLSRGWRIHLLGVLGLAQALKGDASGAREIAKALSEISTFYPMNQLAGDKWIGVAKIYMALKSYQDSLEAARRSDGALIRLLGNVLLGGNMLVYQDLPKTFILYKSLYESGNVKEAQQGYDALLAAPSVQWNGELYWLLLFDRGRMAEAEGDTRQAITFFERAIEVIERQRSTINTEASKIGFVGDKQAVYERLVALLVAQARVSEAFAYVERSKARALVDLLAAKKDFAVGDAESARQALAQLEAADAVSRIQDRTGEAQESMGLRNLSVARQTLRQSAPELSSLVTVESVPPEELRRLIAPDESLVEYYYQGADLYAFVLTGERLTASKLDARGLAQDVQQFREDIQSPGSEAWRKSAAGLHARLWQPIEAHLGVRKVIVVPHGALHYLPFAALLGANGDAIIDRYSLRFLPAASVLKFLKAPLQGKERLLLALGNPDLGDPKLDLRFAEEEARAVAKMQPLSRLLVRKDASESTLRKVAGAFSWIHLAMHGKFEADQPLSSGLHLAKDAENDGVLTVSEIYSMELNADLVTLSACETGLGKVGNGDDVVGLTRGFLYAGSRSIVSSLWSVDDRATAVLMDAFYSNLANRSKQEALRDAVIRARQDFPHPFFWAAFQLTGRAD